MVDALHTGRNGAGWDEAWAASDFELLPYNGFPKYVVAATPWGARRDFGLAEAPIEGTVSAGLDPDARMLVRPFRRIPLASV